MTPREVQVVFRARERAHIRDEEQALGIAVMQAYHTERFARMKRLTTGELKKVLQAVRKRREPAGQTQEQLWSAIRLTHQIVTQKKKGLMAKTQRGKPHG